MWAKIKTWSAGALVGAALTVVVLFVGFAGPAFTAPLGDGMRKVLNEVGIGPGIAFWSVIAILSAVHFVRQHELDEQRDNAQARLERAAATLEHLVRTQPPPEFQRMLGVHFEKALVSCAEANSIPEIEEAITVMIEGLASLASIFDQGSESNRFAANVMLYLSSTDPQATSWFPVVRFLEDGVVLSSLRGMLALDPKFSALTNKDEVKSPDEFMRHFALPVPENLGGPREKHEGGWKVLPGASRVFALNEFEHFSPSTSLGEWCETNGDFTRDVRNRIDQYFARATHMRGFCTAPLLVPTADFEPRAIDRKVLGVLNIHWSNAKLLEREETAKAFCEAIFPIRALISQQILRLHAAGWILPSPPLDATPTPTSTPRPISTPSSGWPRPVVQ